MAQTTREMTEVGAWICVDAQGDSACGSTEETAREAYENEVGPLADCMGFRLIQLTRKVFLPAPTETELPTETDAEYPVDTRPYRPSL